MKQSKFFKMYIDDGEIWIDDSDFERSDHQKNLLDTFVILN